MALHGLSLLIARQLVVDVERFAHTSALRIVPPLCPLEVTPADFTSSAELIERSADATRRWLAAGGMDSDEIPGELRPHAHG